MTGPEHYSAAEAELERIESDTGDDETLQDPAYRMEIIARAQVHATLALAAATIDSGNASWTDMSAKWAEVLR